MQLLHDTCTRITPVDPRVAAETQQILDRKTKPRRSLGRLEDIACQVTAIRGTTDVGVPVKAIVVMGADHGVAEEGVSAYPQEVTGQMLLNFARGGAAINVLARHVGARVVVVDVGVKAPLPADLGIRAERIGCGTRNFVCGPAMSREEAIRAIEVGIRIARELADEGVTLVGIGEMGIANTTAASALASAFTGAPADEVTGRGTGIDDATLRKKIETVRKALALHRPDPADPLGTLAKLGGFEIAGLCGVVLGAAAARIPVVMDGFIASSAALCAVRIAPDVAGYLLASHRSVEAGHRLVLAAIGAKPLFDLDMRLGEGTGAAIAMNLVEASIRILGEMATFASAGVSDSGA
jgi:nicotinate-nucleotide--dimethylbenzimidazole phosphoribosyltransferase